MLKLLFAATCLLSGIAGFSEEPSNAGNEESLSLVYIGRGNANLSARDFRLALDDFQKASILLSNQPAHPVEMDFLVSFGKAIASDNLGLFEECENEIESLFYIVNRQEDRSGLNELPSFELDPEMTKADQMMTDLANLSPTPIIRDSLLEIINEMSEECLPSFFMAKPILFSEMDWQYGVGCNDADVLQCKSIWKRIEKFAKNAFRVFLKAKLVWDFVKDVSDTIQKD